MRFALGMTLLSLLLLLPSLAQGQSAEPVLRCSRDCDPKEINGNVVREPGRGGDLPLDP